MADKENLKNILDHNPRVDQNVIEKFEKLERQLKKLGIDIKPQAPRGYTPSRGVYYPPCNKVKDASS